MGVKVTLAGQDISSYVQEASIQINPTLAQGSGTGNGTSGRSSTCQFLSSLGPANSAIGAGTALPPVVTNLFEVNQANVEEDTSGFASAAGVTLQHDTSTAWEETSSLKVKTDGTYNYQWMYAGLPASTFTPSTTYTFSLYAKGANGTESLRIYCQVNNNESGNTSEGPVNTYTLSTSWTRYTVTVTMPATFSNGGFAFTDIGLRLDTGTAGGTGEACTYWVDGLQVEKGSTATTWHVGTTAPSLVRMGEVIIYDAANNAIYGGYASQLDDQTVFTRIYTQITAEDYWQHTDRIIITTETFTAETDIQIIKYLCSTYAPWIDQSLLPSTPAYTFPTLPVRSKSLQWALQKIVDTVGYQIFITPDKKIHYEAPFQAQTAPFGLSTSPTFNTTQPFQVTDLTVDDTAAINRVFFFGGKRPSNDFIQDLSPQANGNNTTFVLAYYPKEATDGKVHAYKNGVDLVVGFAVANDNKPNNVFKSQGGNADVLLNSDAHTMQFDVAPQKTDTLTAKYRFELPLVVTLVNQQSVTFYGGFLDGIISDQNVFDSQTAVQRCKTLLLQQAFGLTTIKCSVWRSGIWPGMLVSVYHNVRGINSTYIVQDCVVNPLGGGQFRYDLTLGAWNWNLMDVLVQVAQAAALQNDNTEQSDTNVAAFIQSENIGLHEVWTVGTARTMGGYYARATAVGDGHDAYPGFFSVSS